jgi:hypothetical protein
MDALKAHVRRAAHGGLRGADQRHDRQSRSAHTHARVVVRNYFSLARTSSISSLGTRPRGSVTLA